jgi:hypothetical protein
MKLKELRGENGLKPWWIQQCGAALANRKRQQNSVQGCKI